MTKLTLDGTPRPWRRPSPPAAWSTDDLTQTGAEIAANGTVSAELWRQGKNTAEIAEILGISEAELWNTRAHRREVPP